MSHYETPEALRHDAHTLAEDARALLEATSSITDEKVAEARKKVEAALAAGNEMYASLQKRAVETARATDQCVRDKPYHFIAAAFGVGAVVGFLLQRRSS
jgi:ElaB/YqjD/DUF883 family membrane-anchored ribosome-binding protein